MAFQDVGSPIDNYFSLFKTTKKGDLTKTILERHSMNSQSIIAVYTNKNKIQHIIFILLKGA
jgi:hypothetical protein